MARRNIKYSLEHLRKYAAKKFDEMMVPNLYSTSEISLNGPEFTNVVIAMKNVDKTLGKDAENLARSSSRYEFCKIISEPNSPFMQKAPETVHAIMAEVLSKEMESEKFLNAGIRKI